MGVGAHSIIHELKPLENEVGIIAGNRPINPITASNLSGENDGTVTVEGTKLPEMKDHIVMPYCHTFIPFKRKIREQVLNFLKNSEFMHYFVSYLSKRLVIKKAFLLGRLFL